ncbi:MAG: hypothetical protein IT158_20625 [Bryobacterales bacterium]|nr:hypothetical protein [Bryobacterales bacterium]
MTRHTIYMGFAGRERISGLLRLAWIAICLWSAGTGAAQTGGRPQTPAATYYDDVLPVLQARCISCHGPGGFEPATLGAYSGARQWAPAIAESVKSRRMPPWLADPAHGEFANHLRIDENEIRLLDLWAAAGAPAGKPRRQRRGLPAVNPADISADVAMTALRPVEIAANEPAGYRYLVFELPFTQDRWVRAVQIRPSDLSAVDHAVLYVREPRSVWLRDAPPGLAYAPSGPDAIARARNTTAEILAAYTPGMPALIFPDGAAKRIPAGSDLVLQVHYRSRPTPVSDEPQVGLVFTREPPGKRVLTLRMEADKLRIPAGETNFKTSLSHTLPAAADLISLFPHLRLRGASFDVELIGPGGGVETLLKVKPSQSGWQWHYVLRNPRALPKGAVLRWTAHFDNVAVDVLKSEPGAPSWHEAMLGFFELAVDPAVDTAAFLPRKADAAPN